ncbi:Transcription factor MBF1 [Spraguea lophii 42_110]|uniref:Transcription factor MBF1 n=1 Tax=Spraguea lophii (strain 42_110) TaxID=1358809 RepID=S7XTY6_SPRLO|nr:Transcription factor MBF1 [Spraguea lophii 42_110]
MLPNYNDKPIIVKKSGYIPKQPTSEQSNKIVLDKRIAKKIVVARENKNINQKEFASLLNKPISKIKEIEAGGVELDDKIIGKIEKLLDMKIK